jgi:ABC-type Mn2+/Zn2+ transport system ATPase subunit
MSHDQAAALVEARNAGSTSEPDPALVEVVGAGFVYDDVPALIDVYLRVSSGDFVAIVGPSGSGKTTLLRLLIGSLPPHSGVVRRPRGLRVGYVPQVETVNWQFPLTVAECVMMARTGRLWPWPSRAERREVDDVLDRLGMAGLQRRHLRALSGGQQQRVFVARALMDRPQLLLLDEPTSAVDMRTRHEMLHLLAELNRDGLAVVVTTHDLNGIATHLPQLVCLNTEVVATGAPAEVLTPEVLERTYGAPLDVLEHAGMLVVVDPYGAGESPSNRAGTSRYDPAETAAPGPLRRRTGA